VPNIEVDAVATQEDDDDASVEQQYPEIDNKTRKKKKSAETLLRNLTPENTSREDIMIEVDTTALAVPSFVEVNQVALERLPEVIKVYQPKKDVPTGSSFYSSWRLLGPNALQRDSEWVAYINLVATLDKASREVPIATFWNSHKTQFPPSCELCSFGLW